MDEQSQPAGNRPTHDGGPTFLNTVTGRLAVVAMVALILAGTVAIIFIVRDRDDASAGPGPNREWVDADFEVTGAEVLSVIPPAISGACPVDATFSAEIQATGAEGTIVYRWVFDDAGPTESVEAFFPPGVTSVIVDLSKALGGAEAKFQDMSEQVFIQVLEQNGESISFESSAMSFDIACS